MEVLNGVEMNRWTRGVNTKLYALQLMDAEGSLLWMMLEVVIQGGGHLREYTDDEGYNTK